MCHDPVKKSLFNWYALLSTGKVSDWDTVEDSALSHMKKKELTGLCCDKCD